MAREDTDAADAALLWTEGEGRDDARRGHAYLFARTGELECLSFQHAPDRTPGMVARLRRWQARHPASPAEALRQRCSWTEPDGPYSFRADLGQVQRLLRGRALVVRSGDDEPPPTLPETYLRAPVRRSIEAALPGARWPERWDASQLRFAYGSPWVASEGGTRVVCAARYGSAYARSGQDRTAAVFLSHDGGQEWEELGWAQSATPPEQSSWPPETVRPRLENGELALTWEDPWSDWEPGYAFEARWDPEHGEWRVLMVG